MTQSNLEASFSVNMGGDFEGQSNRNADAAERMADSLDEELKSLKAMQSALRNLQSGQMGATKEARALKDTIAAQKASIAGSQLQLVQMGASWKRAGKASKDSSTEQVRGMQAMLSQLQGSNTAIGSMLSSTSQLTSVLGKAGLAGAAALVVVAVAAVTAAITGATIALARYALGVLDARRSEMIRLEGLTKLPNWFGIAAGKARDLQGALDRVSTQVALGRDKLEGFAVSLYKSGLRGKNLEAALEGTAIRASVLGDEMGSAFASMAAGAALTGQSVIQMAKRTKEQFGGLAARQMLSFSVQIAKAKENIDALFRGVRIEGFLSKFAVLTEMFSQSTASGRALKIMLETLLNPLFGSANEGAPILKRLFQGMIIGAQAAVIAVLRLRKWWNETFGSIKTNINWSNVAVYTGIAVFGIMTLTLITLTGVVLVLGAALAFVFGATVLTFGLPFVLLGAAIVGVVYAIKYLITWGKQAWSYLKGLPWGEIGSSILAGITGPLSELWTTGVNFGKRMLGGFKEAWGIHSPSTVGRLLVQRDIAGGMQIGAERAAPRVGDAVGAMAYPSRSAMGGASSGPGDRGSSGRGPVHFTFGDININTSSEDPKQQAREVVDEVFRMLELGLVQVGGRF